MTSILIVDDEVQFSHILTRSLSQYGFECQTAHDGQQALEKLKQQRFDALLLDLKLGNDSGLRLLPQLLTLQTDLHIVVLTAYASINTAVEAIKLGACDYLCKPCGSAEIIQALNKKLANAELAIAEAPPSLERLSWERIQTVLAEQSGNVSAAARILGLHRRTLQRKLLKKPVQQ
ncbi:MAG: two-component system response regulator RegA [Pseudohongiellaceae bacterium]|jgi:two-component system response regulator RegA